MNTIINSLALIADAAEYFDRSTSAAWKIRASLTNMLVWTANGLIYAQNQQDGERLHKARVVMATLRVWARDCNTSSFALDLTPGSVRKTLGLERQLDVHAEATRLARAKCLATRSASRFAEHYRHAAASIEERMRQREANVAEISDILADTGFVLDGQIFDGRGYDTTYDNEFVSDNDLYDEDAVTDQHDKLAEVIGNALEAMLNECEVQLASAITSPKIARLSGYRKGIVEMMRVVGVDTEALAKRQVALERQIQSAIQSVEGDNAKLDEAIEAELAALATPAEPTPVESLAGKPVSLSYEQRKADETARAAEREADAKRRSEAARKAAATRAKNKLAQQQQA